MIIDKLKEMHEIYKYLFSLKEVQRAYLAMLILTVSITCIITPFTFGTWFIMWIMIGDGSFFQMNSFKSMNSAS
jgi:hypothetical protein